MPSGLERAAMRITIITPSLNQAEHLRACLASVREQEGVEVEHIVVDGGSTDGSVGILSASAQGLAWWCSEKDRGQSHAINKGLARATGDVIGWLNSDDELLPGALRRVKEVFEAHASAMVVCGRRRLQHGDGRSERSPLEGNWRGEAMFTHPHVNQQATFYRTAVVRGVGGVDEALHYVMDLELWWRVLIAYGPKAVSSVDSELALFRLHPAAKTASAPGAFQMETAALLREMAAATGSGSVVELIERAYGTGGKTRAWSLSPEQAPLVRRMVIHFLLKWHGAVRNRTEFELMRAMMRRLAPSTDEVDATLKERWITAQQTVRDGSWFLHRVRRKWRTWRA